MSSSALGVRAVAEPAHLEVDPGDGSRVMTCPFVTSKSDECVYVYERASSTDGGDDGYPARMRTVYSLSFEMGGRPVEVDGAPTTIESDWVTREVPVREVQAVGVPGE